MVANSQKSATLDLKFLELYDAANEFQSSLVRYQKAQMRFFTRLCNLNLEELSEDSREVEDLLTKNEIVKPCPCCKSSAKIIHGEDDYMIICLECGLNLKDKSKEKAIRKWNRRS